jgi:hypothetical protein
MPNKKKKLWREYLWAASVLYLLLGLFNIISAWIGMLCFTIPLVVSAAGGGKSYCNSYCGRGQLLYLLGTRYKLSKNRNIPMLLKAKWFRFGFLAFFLVMFANMIFSTFLVFRGANDLTETITLLWTWKVPWQWVNTSFVSPWIAQFAFGFYSMMLTSTLLGIITMVLYKPRSWCVYCPMGTVTQAISVHKYKKTG